MAKDKQPIMRMLALTMRAPPRPIWLARIDPTRGAIIDDIYCKLCASETKVALYSAGKVCINSSKKTRSNPAWNMPESPANTAINHTCPVKATRIGCSDRPKVVQNSTILLPRRRDCLDQKKYPIIKIADWAVLMTPIQASDACTWRT